MGQFTKIDFSEFHAQREEKLKRLYRYSRFALMQYRSSNWMHAHRMLWMIEELAPLLKKHVPKLDINKCRVLALVHDDAEIITGDIQAGHKAQMNQKQLAKLDEDEEVAIYELAKKFPRTVAGYSYRGLLFEALRKNTLESQVVNYFDKLDAYNESLHEFVSGNISILRSIMFYSRSISTYPYIFPKLKTFFEDKSSPLTFIDDRKISPVIYPKSYSKLKPFTAKNIENISEFPTYDAWKKVVLKRGGKDGLNWLIGQREYMMSK